MNNISIDNHLKVKLYYCYAANDSHLLNELEKHLLILCNEGLIAPWSRKEILPGREIEAIAKSHIQEADIILLLISPDFFATDYIYNFEMRVAEERHNANISQVVVVYLRSIDYKSTPISNFQILPDREHPINDSFWQSKDMAFTEVSKSLKATIHEIRNNKIKSFFLRKNQNLIKSWEESKDSKKKEEIAKKISEIFVEQNIIASFDAKTLYHPVVGSRSETTNSPWCIYKYEKIHLHSSLLYSSRSEYYPFLVLINEFNNEPHTLYIKHYSKVINICGENLIMKKGDVIGTIKVPLIKIIANREKKEPHWTISRGSSGYAGVLTYQPDLIFWIPNLRVRFKALDRQFGCLKVDAPNAGKFNYSLKELKVGAKINSGDVIGVLNDIVIKSPLTGSISSWLPNESGLIYKNQTLMFIR